MPTHGAKRPRRPPLGELLSEREAEGGATMNDMRSVLHTPL